MGYNTNSINTDIMSHLNTEAGNMDLLTYPKDATSSRLLTGMDILRPTDVFM